MSRSKRLLQLLQLLRSHRFPVPGAQLATSLGISLRTLYRDIATLQEQGAHIEGEAGLGYVLRPGFLLPPLMFSPEEIEALVLGSRWVADRGDGKLQDAAKSTLSKIAAVLPKELTETLLSTALLVPPATRKLEETIDLAELRRAIRSGCKAALHYRDVNRAPSHRTIWPFALGYFEDVRVLAAWCELRGAFRHFRTDRILTLEISGERYPTPRQTLLNTWRKTLSIPDLSLITADRN